MKIEISEDVKNKHKWMKAWKNLEILKYQKINSCHYYGGPWGSQASFGLWEPETPVQIWAVPSLNR